MSATEAAITCTETQNLDGRELLAHDRRHAGDVDAVDILEPVRDAAGGATVRPGRVRLDRGPAAPGDGSPGHAGGAAGDDGDDGGPGGRQALGRAPAGADLGERLPRPDAGRAALGSDRLAPAAGAADLAVAGSVAIAAPDLEPDEQLIRLWLNGRSEHTQRSYRGSVDRFRAFSHKPIRDVTLADLQLYAEHLGRLELAPASAIVKLSAVKSLFAFAARLRYLPFDTAAPLRLPPMRDQLAERILEADDVRRLLAAADTPRNRLILELLYVAGVRVSELVALTWRDARPHRGAGQITVFGKGGKTRTIRVEGPSWSTLLATKHAEATPADPVFVSRKGGHLHPSAVWRIVKGAAKRAGVDPRVSCHWLRHCHASHALDNGAPLHLIQQTLGHASIATTSRYLHARPNESSGRFLPSLT